jgi:hypothetical protein
MSGKVSYYFRNGSYTYTVRTSTALWAGMDPQAVVEVARTGVHSPPKAA